MATTDSVFVAVVAAMLWGHQGQEGSEGMGQRTTYSSTRAATLPAVYLVLAVHALKLNYSSYLCFCSAN